MNSANNHDTNGDRRAEVEKLAAQLAQLLAGAAAPERQTLETAFAAGVLQNLAEADPATDPLFQSLKSPPLTPELRAWLDQQHTEEEMVAWVREFKEKGGMELSEFLPELKQLVDQP